MSNTVRYGLIGAGMMAREHIRNLALIPGAAVTAVADPDAGSRESAAAAAGSAPAPFEDHRALLEHADLDALVIASPNDTHAGILRDIFASGRALPVLVEKPVCTTLADCASLAAAARSYRAPLWVAMEYRYMPPVAELLAELRAGTAGRLRMLAIREHRYPFLHKVGDWNRFSARTGGTLVEKCCHYFDLMRLIVQDEPVRIYASGAADVNHRDERYGGATPDIIDNAYAVLDFRNGVRAALDLCMFAEGAWFQEEIAATGERARIDCLIPGPRRFWRDGAQRHAELVVSPRATRDPQRRKVHVDEAALAAGDHHGSTYYQHLGFSRAIAGGPVEVTLSDGLKAVAIGLAAERSAAERRAVELDLSGF